MLFRSCLGVCLAAGLLLSGAALADQVRYDDYKLVRVVVGSVEQINQIHAVGGRLMSENEGLGAVDYLFPPDAMAGLASLHLSYQVLNDNVQKAIDAERARLEQLRDVGPLDPAWFEDFKDYDQIADKLDQMVADRPDLCTVFSIGNSFEERPIWAISITAPGGEKPMVVFDGTHHAREWITPMAVMWVADRLVYEYDTNPTIHDILDTVEVVVIPVINPDGYVYSWTSERYWRKNRHTPPSGYSCYGVDLNRNYDAGWGGVGADGYPCSDVYYGSSAGSEPEVQAYCNFVDAHPRIVSGISYHANSEMILSPYGYTSALPPEPDQSLFAFCDQTMHDEILAVHGRSYAYGPVWSTIYPASGGTLDWCYDAHHVFEFTIELPGIDFVIPPSEIIPYSEENFEAARFLMEWSAGPVRITFPQGLPEYISPVVPTAFAVRIEDGYQTAVPSSATLYYSYDGASFETAAIVHTSGTLYEATLPPAECGTTPRFYFSAAGDGGAVAYRPATAPDDTFTATVALVTMALNDDFESDLGWTVSNDPSLTTGAWERAVPRSPASVGAPSVDFDSSGKCFVTDNRAGNYDVDGGPTRLLSPTVDLSTFHNPILRYARWISCDDPLPPAQDFLNVEVSDDDGANWVLVEHVSGNGNWADRQWQVADFVNLTSQFRVRFSVSDNPNNSLTEAGVDAVRVYDVTCSTSGPGDLNCDGTINGYDIDPFVLALTDPGAYAASYPTCDIQLADINDDGLINGYDIDPFVALLTGGR
jgi:murein tripeptide amidase MpaA